MPISKCENLRPRDRYGCTYYIRVQFKHSGKPLVLQRIFVIGLGRSWSPTVPLVLNFTVKWQPIFPQVSLTAELINATAHQHYCQKLRQGLPDMGANRRGDYIFYRIHNSSRTKPENFPDGRGTSPEGSHDPWRHHWLTAAVPLLLVVPGRQDQLTV